MNEFLRSFLFLGLTAPFATAQSPSANLADTNGPDLDGLIQEWRTDNGGSWRVRENGANGYAEYLYGGNASPVFVPRGDSQWTELAREFVVQTESMHGIPSAELRTVSVKLIPLGMAGLTDKMAVNFIQEIGGVRVVGGHVDALFDMEGRLLSIHSTALPELTGISTQPTVAGDVASRAAIAAFDLSYGVPTDVQPAKLVIARATVGELIEGRLAWQIEVSRDIQGEGPAGEIITVDAQSGEILDRATTVHNFDVSGQIVSMATPGSQPDSGANPEVQIPMPFMRVTSSAGTTITDVNGNFNYPGVNSATNITVDYFGDYNNVNNQAGGDYSLTTLVQPNTPTTVVMNPSSQALVTAQANAYLHINTVGEFIRNTAPGDTTADFRAVSNPNLTATCNAFFDGGSTNYYQAGGGCVNTAYSTVVGHEFGHWLNVLYNTGNGSDGMGEGNADVFAMYAFDGPIVGFDFCGNSCHIRTGNNSRQYCGDGNGGCHGGVHASGEVWMGAAWKVRRNLKATLGNAAGSAVADSLFMGWMNSYNQSQIDSVIELQWLTLDDDDGNIDNGTPNHGDINDAFLEQGFPGFDLPAVIFSNVTELGNTPSPGPFSVSATVIANLAPAIQGVDLKWRASGGSFQTVSMNPMGGDVYNASIPAQVIPEVVEYYLEGTDTAANTDTFPSAAPAELIRFGIGDIVPIFSFDFEPALSDNEGWISGAAGDNATTGIWDRRNPIGTGAQPEDDVSVPGVRCWFTGQGPNGGALGDNDIDNGTTTLLSPIFDADGLAGATISYWRWYSNDTGSAPNADTMVIDISNNGGANWSNVETIGPAGSQSSGGWIFHEFLVSSVTTPSSNMQLRFRASDLGTGSVVEAAIDEVQGFGFESGCPAPTNYCISVPNSGSPSGATIGFSGSASVAANNLTLTASEMPAGQNGLFYFGPNEGSVVFGNGFRCISGTLTRLPIVTTNGSGEASYALDLGNLPGAASIGAGDTVKFQFWFRDPAGGGPAFNLTDGLSATFCP